MEELHETDLSGDRVVIISLFNLNVKIISFQLSCEKEDVLSSPGMTGIRRRRSRRRGTG